MGKRRNVDLRTITKTDIHRMLDADKARFNEPMNQTMRKIVRQGEEGPGAKARKIGKVQWPEGTE